jgi:iron complex outermembrane receptor protein
VLTQAQNGDHQRQFTQEFPLASSGSRKLDYVGGLYLFSEQMGAIGAQHYGNAAAAFLLKSTLPSVVADGYALDYRASYHTTSLAAFGQAVWHITPALKFTGGLRYTYDRKSGWFNQIASGGAPLTGALAPFAPLRAALGTSTHFDVRFDDGDVSGLADLSYQVTPDIMVYANYARGDKSGGLNLTQLPAGASSVIAPETLDAYEAGLKSRLFDGALTLNAALFWQEDQNYQANIVDPALGKQYLSNVPKVRSRGVEIDGAARIGRDLSLYTSLTYDDAIYESYANGVCGLERITAGRCNLSGADLAGVPKWSLSAGGEYHRSVSDKVEAFGGFDFTFRSSVYSAATDSVYSKLPDLSLVNARLGVRDKDAAWNAYLWVKNLADETYFTFISPGVGNTGALFSQLGEPRAFGATFRLKY